LLSSTVDAADVPGLKPFLEKHCYDCHDAESRKGGLRLDNLAVDFDDGKTSATWADVHDKIASGEMPPKKKARPAQAELITVTKGLHTQLLSASLEQQRTKGRVLVRRLNGTEYETVVRDLLGTDVALRELLPEDSSTAGFDNVSAGLELSATHFLRYQEAAAKAVQSVIPPGPPIPMADTRTGKDMTKFGPNFKQTLGRSCKLDGDALIFYSKLPRYGLCATPAVRAAGRYRVQLKAGAVGNDGKALPVGFMAVMSQGREAPLLREVREIPSGAPQVIEFEIDLERQQAFVVNLLTSWDIRGTKKTIDEYAGPGLRVEWLKIEGPVNPFPGPAYDTLFAGVPLKAQSVAKALNEGTKPPIISDKRTVDTWASDPLVPVSAKPKEDAERLIRAFLPKAFRRPVSEPTVKRFVGKVHTRLDQKHTFADAMAYGYKLILSSPDFLFLLDPPGAVADTKGNLLSTKLDDYALATRLSFFLWSSGPDEALMEAARRGELSKPAALRAQVERMLDSPKAHRFTVNFTGQWLDLRKIDFTIPDPQLYPDFDYLLLAAMPQETERFFEEVLRKDLSLLCFVDSDWSMLNERLARLYGIPGVEGNALRRVSLPANSHRGGVMTQASVLKVTADGTRTSPVLRGKWILERIIGKPPAPPPPNIPAIEPDIRGATTIRELLAKHRNAPACASCHNQIDPPGFALENFDPIGNWRDFYRVTTRTKAGTVNLPYSGGRPVYRGLDVEKGGQTPDGRSFADITDYRRILLEDKDQLARNLTQKLLIYSTGADIQYADREVVEAIVARLRGSNYGFRSLVHEVTQSRIFLNK
jgi:hypothetical protein